MPILLTKVKNELPASLPEFLGLVPDLYLCFNVFVLNFEEYVRWRVKIDVKINNHKNWAHFRDTRQPRQEDLSEPRRSKPSC